MKTKIKAVVFDAGGVLVDWETICRKFAAEAGINEVKFFKVFLDLSFDSKTGSDLGKITTDEFFQKLATTLGMVKKWKSWRRRFARGFKRIEPTYKLLDLLKGKFRLAILSNSKKDLIAEWEDIGRIKQYFTLVIDSSEVKLIKPDPRIFILTYQKLKLKPEECLFVDDDEKNIKAAQKLGFQTVHFTDPKTGVALVKKKLGLG